MSLILTITSADSKQADGIDDSSRLRALQTPDTPFLQNGHSNKRSFLDAHPEDADAVLFANKRSHTSCNPLKHEENCK